MLTVGLDFGTHQTKVCVERAEGVELSYSFFTFKDAKGKPQYTLPSIIRKESDGCLSYGYLTKKPMRIFHNGNEKIIRYFKQMTFLDNVPKEEKEEAMLYSIWYIAYIIFDLEQAYGTDFAIQMGVPTDSGWFYFRKKTAVRIIASAYKLVEDVFENDKKRFLNTTEEELREVTAVCDYSNEIREEYQMLIFPEAYACLKPLTSSSRIPGGMSLLVDIGGGTTDISFFTLKKRKPHIYGFYSIDKGLNYLTNAIDSKYDTRTDSNVESEYELQQDRIVAFEKGIDNVCQKLISELLSEFRLQSDLQMSQLMDALKSRPIIYTGGGSTFPSLCSRYQDFKDVKCVTGQDWRKESVNDMEKIESLGLCPILSTAYGLAIHATDDNIQCEPFKDIFANIRVKKNKTKKAPIHPNSRFGSAYGGFNYTDDYDAWK